MAVDSVTHDVSSWSTRPNARISPFSSAGTFIRAFGAGVAIGTGTWGIAVDSSTHIVYVASGAAQAAYFDGTTGTFLGEFTGPTASPGVCEVTMNEAKTAMATFVEQAPEVTSTARALAVRGPARPCAGRSTPTANTVTGCRIECTRASTRS